jgi:hypothetical protein
MPPGSQLARPSDPHLRAARSPDGSYDFRLILFSRTRNL